MQLLWTTECVYRIDLLSSYVLKWQSYLWTYLSALKLWATTKKDTITYPVWKAWRLKEKLNSWEAQQSWVHWVDPSGFCKASEHCVQQTSGSKMIFGKGTQLTVQLGKWRKHWTLFLKTVWDPFYSSSWVCDFLTHLCSYASSAWLNDTLSISSETVQSWRCTHAAKYSFC